MTGRSKVRQRHEEADQITCNSKRAGMDGVQGLGSLPAQLTGGSATR